MEGEGIGVFGGVWDAVSLKETLVLDRGAAVGFERLRAGEGQPRCEKWRADVQSQGWVLCEVIGQRMYTERTKQRTSFRRNGWPCSP